MTPERWQAVKSVLDGALDLEGPRREAYLLQACGADAQLRREVDSLLEAHAGADRFLADDATALIEREEGWSERSLVGAYRLLSVLGEGGMGKVFLAERADGQFQQQVALKRLKSFVSEDARNRFLRERQILARLEHPAIARLLDGGVVGGTPYFVMEYVPGKSITDHCRERTLGVRAILELFLRVCEAVEYAHRHLVVHRDLKPANVVVTEEGAVKLLDFGIAKLLDDEGHGLTRTQARPMTPEYATPEQVLGEPITTATDVHALGLLLYELLTGVRPFAAARDVIELAQAIVSSHPSPPSALAPARRRELKGDLDAVVLKALEKEPARRYPTASELAADLRRYLAGERVEAQAYSRWALLRRWLGRHRVGAAAAVGVVAVVLVVSVLSFRRVVAERDRADRLKVQADARRAAAEQLAEFMVVKLSEDLETVGRLDLLAGVGQQVQTYYDAVDLADPAASPDAQERRAKALDVIGKVTADKGDRPRALAIYEKALQIRLTALKKDPADVGRQRAVSNSLTRIGDIKGVLGDGKGASEAFREALAYASGLAVAHPEEIAFTRNAARIEMRLGTLFYDQGQPEASLAAYRAARDRLEQALKLHPGDEAAQVDLAWTEINIGNFHRRRGDLALALPFLEQALERRRELAARSPDNMQRLSELAYTHSVIGQLHLARQDLEAAGRAFARARDVRESLARRDPSNAIWQTSLAAALRDECDLDRLRRRFLRAADTCRRALEIDKALFRKTPSSTDLKYALSQGYLYVAQVARDRGDARRAVEAARQARALRDELAKASPDAFWVRAQAVAGHLLGQALALEDPRAAVDALQESLALTRGLLARDADNRVLQQGLVERLLSLIEVEMARGRLAEADAAVREALPVLDRLIGQAAPEPDVAYHRAAVLLARAEIERRRGQQGAARETLKEALALLEQLARDGRLTVGRQAELARARRMWNGVFDSRGGFR